MLTPLHVAPQSSSPNPILMLNGFFQLFLNLPDHGNFAFTAHLIVNPIAIFEGMARTVLSYWH
ncbi:hypothetical protein H5410_049672 [Solanum commersonii]|uniref:Uncharacterized protein n=1 Tax=Solanum commersonii TaxID=4109 RepID=A0A9J5WUV3_SOLCO|nr:hypothetical protein H5410_049672 [Solanum commersonii]